MTFRQFEKALTKLKERYPTGIPREELLAVYSEIRNSTAYELARKQEQLDRLLPLYHKKVLQEGEPES